MKIHYDLEEVLEKYEVTKIEDHHTDEDLNQVTKVLTNTTGSVANKKWRGERPHWNGC